MFGNYSGGHVDDIELCYFADGLFTTTEQHELYAHVKRCLSCKWKVENREEYLAIDPDEKKNHWTNKQPG